MVSLVGSCRRVFNQLEARDSVCDRARRDETSDGEPCNWATHCGLEIFV